MIFSIWHKIRPLIGLTIVSVLSACGGGGATTATTSHSSVVASITNAGTGAKIGDPNVVALYIDSGPTGTSGATNIMYATVQVCAPSSATNCATVDHVLVDTGSTGLRLVASALPSSLLAALPAVTVSGNPVGECLTFVAGFTWGGLRQLDLHLGGNNFSGETASNISAQIIADPATQLSTIPVSCITAAGYTGSSTDQTAIAAYEAANEMQTVAQLGANGIIGIGLFQQDCGTDCQNPTPQYQVCSNGGCSNSALPVGRQVSNPISAFATDSNGSAIVLPALANGYADSVSGMLVLGIGTQTNNALAANSTVIGALPYSAGSTRGTFSATFNGVSSLTGSYFDSGTNWNYFPTTGAVTTTYPYCSNSVTYLCPPTPITQTASLTGTGLGTTMTSGMASVYTANVNHIFTLDPSANAILGLAGSSATNLVLGGSFFFGRTITTLIENQSAVGFTTSVGTGPAYGYTP